MRKIFAIVLSVIIFTATFGAVVMAEEAEASAEAVVSPDLQEAKEVVDILAGSALFPEQTVTRAAFVSAMLQFMQIEPKSPQDCFFSDVKSFEEFAPAVYTAADLGWISRGEEFEPERSIAPSEALKIIIRMLNYEMISRNKGDYPAGDLYVANRLDLLDGVDMSAEALSGDDAYMLLYHAGMTPSFQQIAFGNEEQYTENGETILESVYHVYTVEGIINRTPYNTLDGDERIGWENVIEIEGVAYEADDVSWDMLGVKGRAFLRENENGRRDKALYIRDLSKRTVIPLSDVKGKEDTSVQYWSEDGSKIHTIRLSPNSQVILNGRKLSSGIDQCFTSGAGSVILADNDKNGAYDVVFVNRYRYAVALGYDSVTETFRDKYSSSGTIAFDQKAVILQDEAGAELNPLSISGDNSFRIIQSQDGGFVFMKRLYMAVSGVVNRIDPEHKTLTIDGTEYIMSDYFIENFMDQTEAGAEGSFHIDENHILVSSAGSGADMRYGYLVNCVWTGSFESTLAMRIFTQSGVFEEFEVRDKVLLDGVRGCKKEQVYAVLSSGGAVTPQLIKYAAAGDGRIKTVDTASAELPEEAGVYNDSSNSLTRYDKMSVSLRYSSTSQAMGAMYGIVGSTLFCIPPDLTKEEEFQIRGSDFFVNDGQYTFQVYDIDQNGTAGALLYTGSNVYSVHPDNPSMVIGEVGTKLNGDGEEVYEIYGWRGGAYITIELKSDFAVSKQAAGGVPVKSNHDLLSSGDIIGYATDANSNIKALSVIYDARQGVMASNASGFNNDQRAAPMYYEGMVYSVSGGYVAISIGKTAGGFDFSQDNLRYIKLASSNLVSYDAGTGEIRPLASDEIRTYKTDGADAHYGVFCLSNFALKTAVFYEDMEARK